MFNKFLNVFKPSEPSIACVPAGERVYAVGDIHGRLDLVLRLMDKLADDLKSSSIKPTLIFLGDYIDRGPKAKEVLDYLMAGVLPVKNVIHLRGNHEQVLLDILDTTIDDPRLFPSWLGFGGRETLGSFGVSATELYGDDEETLEKRTPLAIPEAHQAFLQSTRLSHQIGDYFFAHAGIRPIVPLDKQRPQDLLWIGKPFLSSTLKFPAVVVHGHTIAADVQDMPNRIGIDTGAYATGVLSAVVLEGTTRRFLQTR